MLHCAMACMQGNRLVTISGVGRRVYGAERRVRSVGQQPTATGRADGESSGGRLPTVAAQQQQRCTPAWAAGVPTSIAMQTMQVVAAHGARVPQPPTPAALPACEAGGHHRGAESPPHARHRLCTRPTLLAFVAPTRSARAHLLGTAVCCAPGQPSPRMEPAAAAAAIGAAPSPRLPATLAAAPPFATGRAHACCCRPVYASATPALEAATCPAATMRCMLPDQTNGRAAQFPAGQRRRSLTPALQAAAGRAPLLPGLLCWSGCPSCNSAVGVVPRGMVPGDQTARRGATWARCHVVQNDSHDRGRIRTCALSDCGLNTAPWTTRPRDRLENRLSAIGVIIGELPRISSPAAR